MKEFSKYLIYVSIGFVIFYLYRQGYFIIPENLQYGPLVLSLLLMVISNYIISLQWGYILRIHKLIISNKQLFIGYGLNIFGKYIPGKVATLVGRAGFVYKVTEKSISFLTLTGLQSQLFSLVMGFLVGAIAGIFLPIDFIYLIFLWGLFLLFALIAFNAKLGLIISKVATKMFRRNVEIPFLNISKLYKLIPIYLIPWLVLSVSFYLIINSVDLNHYDFKLGFIFPLAGSLGIVMIFAPGGLGVREGVLIGLLVLCKIDASVALSISVLQRLLTILSELIIFIIAFIWNKFHLKYRE